MVNERGGNPPGILHFPLEVLDVALSNMGFTRKKLGSLLLGWVCVYPAIFGTIVKDLCMGGSKMLNLLEWVTEWSPILGWPGNG